MEDKIFLATLLYKSIVEKSNDKRHLSYKVLGPMMGTVEDGVFINTHDRKYLSIEKLSINMNDNIRYSYYNLISLKEAKERYETEVLETIVEKYKRVHEKDYYYVMDIDDDNPFTIRYDASKFKKVFDSNVAKPL